MPPLSLTYSDLMPFSDLGTSVETEASAFIVMRNGRRTKVKPEGEGYNVTTSTSKIFQPCAAAVLADPAFADLPRIARNQELVLSSQRIMTNPVPVTSKLEHIVGASINFVQNETPWTALDSWLRHQKESQNVDGTDLLLIDGPAGVGKTTIVRETALLRAEKYDGSAPLIVPIASRGRVLQNISDLVAFALQDFRSNLTIAQLRSLMRHGLITLAIDGFDELSDPNGFETAWSGLNGIISDVRGAATFLLAGRETFVSTKLMRRQLKSFDDSRDRLSALSIGDPNPTDARNWLLRQNGWSFELLSKDFVEPIFVEGSYALRPFFLDVIAREPSALTSESPPASDLLSYLVNVMTEREAQKFVEELDPPGGNVASRLYEAYVRRFLEEVARDLAETQSEAIAEDALDLLATVAADGLLPDDQVAAVAQRARTVVFLANDVRAGHVAFSHEQLLQHFLAREALRSVGEGEKPRYIRRNLFGRESLEVFAHVAKERKEEAENFIAAVRKSLAKPTRDRTNTNLAVLGIAAACAVAPTDANLTIEGIGISEMYFPFAVPPGIRIRDTTISIMRGSSADLRNLQCDDGVHIATLEIDRLTQLPDVLPAPQTLVYPGGTTSNKNDISRLLAPISSREQEIGKLAWTSEIYELLGRIDRYRAFWLRTNIEDTDQQGRRIISHTSWPSVYKALQELGLITVKSRQASGVRADFVHFRQDIDLTEDENLYRALEGNC